MLCSLFSVFQFSLRTLAVADDVNLRPFFFFCYFLSEMLALTPNQITPFRSRASLNFHCTAWTVNLGHARDRISVPSLDVKALK